MSGRSDYCFVAGPPNSKRPLYVFIIHKKIFAKQTDFFNRLFFYKQGAAGDVFRVSYFFVARIFVNSAVLDMAPAVDPAENTAVVPDTVFFREIIYFGSNDADLFIRFVRFYHLA